MKKINLKYLLSLTVFISFFGMEIFAAPQVSPYEPQVVKAFADSLYQEGFLNQAEGEYKRYLFSTDSFEALSKSQQQDYQATIMSLCNIYKNQKDKNGINWLKNNFFEIAEPVTKEKINLVNAGFIFAERDDKAFSLFTTSDSFAANNDIFSPEFVNLIYASDYLLKKDINSLTQLTSSISPQFPVFQKLDELCVNYKKKSPGLALLFSAVLPGSGKWYTGSFKTFFSSFLTVGSFVAGTVITGMQTSWKSWQPYVFGACGLVLYITDLYGSYQSAKRYNDALYRTLCEETDKIYEAIY